MEYKSIKLRAMEPEDLELLYDWENDENYWDISNTIVPFSKYTLKRYLENSHKNVYETGQLRLMIDLKDDNSTIGTIDIFEFDPFHKRAGIGILIADEINRGKGYGSMSLVCLKNYCFNTLKLHQLYCNIMADNARSIHLFKKHGFEETGIRKEWILTDNGYVNVCIFQLINK